MSIKNFITTDHELHSRYSSEWRLAWNSYIGSAEYKRARYLKAYKVDFETPNDTIKTYDVASDGRITNTYNTKLNPVRTQAEADRGFDAYEGTFYAEKLENTPLYPYVRLYTNQYNSMLFRNPPVRSIDSPVFESEVEGFLGDVDGEGNSINDFMSQVDVMTTVFGVAWIACVKATEAAAPHWSIHTPLSVRNWKYEYYPDGRLELCELVIDLGTDSGCRVLRYYTNEMISTIWLPETTGAKPNLPEVEGIYESDGMYVYEQLNELGYVPVVPVYQGQKLYNGVGITPIHDIAQIQRSIYGHNAEIYSAITYGAHPVLVIDEATANLNEGKIGAEPGSIVTVPEPLPGQASSYVYQFAAPPLESIAEIRSLIEQEISKMNEIAMVQGSDMIRQSSSGVQLEQSNEKVEAFIRKKASNLENAEVKLWRTWFDWLGQPLPEDFKISYSKSYNRRGIGQEVTEIKGLVELFDQYQQIFGADQPETTEPRTANQDDIEDMREALRSKFKNLLLSSYTENGQ